MDTSLYDELIAITNETKLQKIGALLEALNAVDETIFTDVMKDAARNGYTNIGFIVNSKCIVTDYYSSSKKCKIDYNAILTDTAIIIDDETISAIAAWLAAKFTNADSRFDVTVKSYDDDDFYDDDNLIVIIDWSE
jgi:hypothetical protein